MAKKIKKQGKKKSELEYVELEEVFTSIDVSQVIFVKSLLGGSGIKYVVQGDHHFVRGNMFGVYPIPVRFLVPAHQAADARALLKDM